MEEHIFLIGFMGAGKTTVSWKLGERSGVEVLDTDQMLVEQEGKSISRIFEEDGETYFRDRETELLKTLQGRKPAVISCGGGVPLREENGLLMKQCGKVVWLNATPETIYERVKNSTDRPLLNGNMNVPYIRSMMESRREAYASCASHIIDTDGRSFAEIVEEILSL